MGEYTKNFLSNVRNILAEKDALEKSIQEKRKNILRDLENQVIENFSEDWINIDILTRLLGLDCVEKIKNDEYIFSAGPEFKRVISKIREHTYGFNLIHDDSNNVLLHWDLEEWAKLFMYESDKKIPKTYEVKIDILNTFLEEFPYYYRKMLTSIEKEIEDKKQYNENLKKIIEDMSLG